MGLRMVELTISEIHFIRRNLIARVEWIKDNPDCFSIEEEEKECVDSTLEKISKLMANLEVRNG